MRLTLICVSGTLFKSTAAQDDNLIELKVDFEWDWNMENTCGPRPQGPKYPYPGEPLAQNGTVPPASKCDIIADDKYIFNYHCAAPCQTDPAIEVELSCNCFFQVGPVRNVVPCEWQWKDDVQCPEVPAEDQFDWTCDPRSTSCPEGQYEKPEEPDVLGQISNFFSNFWRSGRSGPGALGPGPDGPGSNPDDEALIYAPHWDVTNETNPVIPLSSHGRPIIISPILTQTIGDISHMGAKEPQIHSAPGDTLGHLDVNGTRIVYLHAEEDEKKDLKITQMTEKIHSLKSIIKKAGENRAFERQQAQLILDTAKDSFQSERKEFAHEQEAIKEMYESRLAEMEKQKTDLLDELNRLKGGHHARGMLHDAGRHHVAQFEAYEEEEEEEQESARSRSKVTLEEGSGTLDDEEAQRRHRRKQERRKLWSKLQLKAERKAAEKAARIFARKSNR